MRIGQAISRMKAARTSPLRRALQADNGFFLPVLIGVIVYLAAVSTAAILLLSPQTDRREAINRLIVQLPSLNDTAADFQRASIILPTLLALPGVAKVDLICPPASASPVLQQVVTAHSMTPASPLTGIAMAVRAETGDAVPALQQRLLAELPESQVTSGDEFAERVLRPIYAIQGLTLVILGLLVATLCAGVGFTMGARLKPTSEAVGLLHSLGADETTLVRVIVLNTVWSALWGAVGGAVSAMLTFVAFAGLAGAGLVAGAADVSQIWAIWALILVLPAGAVVLVAISAWLFTRRAFAALP